MSNAASIKQCLVNLKGIEAQLSSLALNSVDTSAQEVFHQSMLTISTIKNDLQTQVLELERLNLNF
jgi:hypothetical protein